MKPSQYRHARDALGWSHIRLASVIGKTDQGARVIAELEEHRGMLQRELAKRVVLKYTPQLVFHLDDSIERGVRVVRLLDELSVPPEDAPGTGPVAAP